MSRVAGSPVWAEEATFTANFKDTDLKSFIETVGANLNKTIIMGPGVQGKVSIRTMTPLNERQYYQLFLNLLEAQGYAVVPMENDVLKVVKSSAAKVEPLPLVGEGSDNYAGDEMVTKVVPVRNVSVRELAPILRQMIDSAGSGNVVNYDPSNVIMLTGRASVVERLTEVIQRVDHAGNRTEEVIPLDNASASEIARVLESLTKNSGENQPATLKSQIVADERTNSVIVSGELHNAAASTSGSKRFFVLRPVVFLRQTDNVISRQNTMNDSPGLNAVSAARWKCRGAHPCVKP